MDGAQMQMWHHDLDSILWQTFKFVPKGGNEFEIVVKGSGLLVTICGGAGTKSGDGALLQQWHVDAGSAAAQTWCVGFEGAHIWIRSKHTGDFITVQGGAGSADGAMVQHWPHNDGSRSAQLLAFVPSLDQT